MQANKALRYEFGRNWSEFTQTIDENEVQSAEARLRSLLQRDDLSGLQFLDIGCGSGLHALAALRLGAAFARAVDYDPESVRTTKQLLEREWPEKNYSVEVADVLEMSSEPVDIVYSWGVLHHTGDMWRAIDRAAAFVKPGGLLAIAIYRKTMLCGFWTWEKRNYVRLGAVYRGVMVGLYLFVQVMRDLLRFKDPTRRFRRRRPRGMHWYHNMLDWLGGYPYQSATPKDIMDFVEKRGFVTQQSLNAKTGELGLLGSGNVEFLFQRTPGP